MKKKILISHQIPKESITTLFEKYDVTYPTKTLFKHNEIIHLLPSYHGLLCIFTQNVNADVIKAAKNLEVICNYGVGYDKIDVKAASDRNIVVCNTPLSVAKPTAELCFGLILSLFRNIAKHTHELKTQPAYHWNVMENLGYSLSGKNLGILGMGRIGREVAKRAFAFDMNIFYHNRHQLPLAVEKRYDARYVSFKDLVNICDVLSINTPLTNETFHIINKDVFRAMKNSAFLINTARGSVVNENDLITALKNKQIAGAGLDVFENEPTIPVELLEMDNVVLTPHIGSATIEDRVLMGLEASNNFIAFWEKKHPTNVVNPSSLVKT